MGIGGNDMLTGGAGNDILIAGSGSNILNGTDFIREGVNEQDTLVGALGRADQFVLGDFSGAYYLDESDGDASLARIRNFESLDTIVLNGDSSDYRIGIDGGNSVIFNIGNGSDDAIGIIENTVGLNLNSDQFDFVHPCA